MTTGDSHLPGFLPGFIPPPPSTEPQAPQQESFTDPDALGEAVAQWQAQDWAFEPYVLVIPITDAPRIVAGTNPLSCQTAADDQVRTCCRASHRFPAAWGRSDWTGTVCDLSALRPESHPRNHPAEAVLTAVAVGARLASYSGALHGTVAFHLTGQLPEPIGAWQAQRLLKLTGELWEQRPH